MHTIMSGLACAGNIARFPGVNNIVFVVACSIIKASETCVPGPLSLLPFKAICYNFILHTHRVFNAAVSADINKSVVGPIFDRSLPNVAAKQAQNDDESM